jgi:hypothetical protein
MGLATVFKPINDKPFTYETRSGAVFRCNTSDLRGDIRVTGYSEEPAKFAVEVAEMASHHAIEVWPKLNGFQGYDTLRFILR